MFASLFLFQKINIIFWIGFKNSLIHNSKILKINLTRVKRPLPKNKVIKITSLRSPMTGLYIIKIKALLIKVKIEMTADINNSNILK
jgi:hypothetical protein